MSVRIHPTILCGGAGSRLWPLSRPSRPKPFLALHGEETLLAQTARRLSDPARFGPLQVIGGHTHRFLIAEQMRAAGLTTRIVLEPAPRGTAAAAAVAALTAPGPDTLVLLAPADHVIADEAAFLAAVERGAAAAAAGRLVLFGVEPDRPETGYGYIRRGEALGSAETVAGFAEKPPLDRAEAMLADGRHLWNSGIFLFAAGAMTRELERLAREVLEAARGAVEGAAHDADFVRLGAGFEAAPTVSLDRAVMERTARAAVVPVRCGWTDIGSWSALWELADRDDRGDVRLGPVKAAETSGCYLRSDGPPLVVSGVEDLIVVAAGGAVLVARRGADQAFGPLVDALRATGAPVD